MQSLKDVLKKEIKMTSEKLDISMQEALKDVNYNECNDVQKDFYDQNHDKPYKISVAQMEKFVKKMPKISGGHKRVDPFEGQAQQNNTDFNYGSNIQTNEIEKNLQLIDRAFALMEEYPNLKELDQENKRAIAISCAINQSRADYFNGKK